MKILIIIVSLLIFLNLGCSNEESKYDFEIKNFHPITNYDSDNLTLKSILLDYTDAISEGFIIPSIRQTDKGEFIFDFEIKNKSDKAQRFYYKIYYQNESYKFPEFAKSKDDSLSENIYANENFYGSWENVSKTFDSTDVISTDDKFYSIKNSFRIVGNPRDEKKFYGQQLKNYKPDDEEVVNIINYIKTIPEWYSNVKEKAQKNNISVDKQLYLDAVYNLKNNPKNSKVNNRWKRNPRVGKYSFMLVVTTSANTKDKNVLPDYIQNIGLTNNNNYVNPYYFFLYGKGKNINNLFSQVSDLNLKVSAKPNLSKGIYIDLNEFKSESINIENYNNNCSDNLKMFKNAAFQQFIHYNAGNKIENIPVVADLSNYSKDLYYQNQKKYSNDKRLDVPISNSNCPCKTVISDSANNKIIIKNPGNSKNTFSKENVGVITRNGFTYGKFIVKAKLAKQLNKDYVWSGLTNAVWMINQTYDSNLRRESKGFGYIPKLLNGPSAKREKTLCYSEIDFEILKANRYWPNTSYKKGKGPKETEKDKDKIIVTCTNWDMACTDPIRFTIGVDSIKYQNNFFQIHRWDNWSKNLTIKDVEVENDLFGSEYFYYEIEWTPTEIIWRIGPEKNKMKIVGYMNNTVTSIPNNQMLVVITQEFHIAKWWPEAPFNQNDIPFSINDLIGEIYEIEIE